MGWNPFSGRKRKEAQERAKAAMPPVPSPDALARESPPQQTDRVDEAMVLAAIDEARRELETREQASRRSARRPAPSKPVAGDPQASKTELIHAAMTVHRLKQSALNDLDPAQRDRLRGMAESMLGVSGSKKK